MSPLFTAAFSAPPAAASSAFAVARQLAFGMHADDDGIGLHGLGATDLCAKFHRGFPSEKSRDACFRPIGEAFKECAA